ncbi:hypothetical protein [Vibrio sp. 2CM40D]|uniref:hypothetical protein n=1 Tax=Vibrio sp. 2CM40D TaxID=2929855 RepID=UPI0020BF66AD|nr:hypothetical protein [Vibrio sp. 2CM40D]MCK8112523.1 hypothetical protein [Vibrio sp. 2CM40D]
MLITEELAKVVCKHKFEYFIANDGYLQFYKRPSRQRVNDSSILFTLKVYYEHGLEHGEYVINEFDSVCKQILGLGFGKRSRHRRTQAQGRFVEQDQAIYFDIDENTYKVNCKLWERGDVLNYGYNIPKDADDDYICEITKDDLKMARKMRGSLCANDQRVYLKSVKLTKPKREHSKQVVIKGGTLDLLVDGVEETHTFKTDIKATDELIKTIYSSMLEVEQELCEIDSYVEFEVDPTDLVPSDYTVHVGRTKDAGDNVACVYFSNGIYEYQKSLSQDHYERVSRKLNPVEDKSGLLAFASNDSDEETTAP